MNVRGFTLVEMVVCIAIFAMMTALLVAKYGTFNQSVLLTDLAYDTAITVRTAQTYGLGVQSTGGSNPFNYAYGVEFCANVNGCGTIGSVHLTNNFFVLFSDVKNDKFFDAGNIQQSIYTLTRGAIVSGICVTTDCTAPDGNLRLDITFKRPNPDAIICSTAKCENSTTHVPYPPYPFAGIFIKGTDGSTREVTIRNTGQISVQE
jgi:prepilin-type N-terminal cleavage/methylation domain-containing protein